MKEWVCRDKGHLSVRINSSRQKNFDFPVFVFRHSPIVFGGNDSHAHSFFMKITFRLISLPQLSHMVDVRLTNVMGVGDMRERRTIKIYFFQQCPSKKSFIIRVLISATQAQ